MLQFFDSASTQKSSLISYPGNDTTRHNMPQKSSLIVESTGNNLPSVTPQKSSLTGTWTSQKQLPEILDRP